MKSQIERRVNRRRFTFENYQNMKKKEEATDGVYFPFNGQTTTTQVSSTREKVLKLTQKNLRGGKGWKSSPRLRGCEGAWYRRECKEFFFLRM